MHMSNSSKRILFVLLSLAFLLASVVVYSTLIKPAYAEVMDLRSQLASQSDALIKYQSTLTQVRSLLSQLQNAGQVQNQVSLMLPNGKDVAYFVSQLSQLAAINALTSDNVVTQVAPSKPSQSSVIRSIGKLKAEAKFAGSYAGFKSYLRQLERNMLLIDVTDIRIEGAQQTPTILNYSVSASSYYQEL